MKGLHPITIINARTLAACLLACSLFLISGVARAQMIYKYRDENGTLRFSDRSPAALTQVEAKKAYTSAPDRLISVKQRTQNRQTILYAINEYHGPVEVEISMEKSKNIAPEPSLPARFVIPGASEADMVEIKPAIPGKAFSYRYQWRWAPGDPGAVHNPGGPYRAPFPKGEKYFISQAFNGEYSHRDLHSRYAVDISMPEGTPVVCTRSGVVMDTRDNYFWGGTEKSYYGNRSNIIRILHDDGTMALYAHLEMSSIRVSPGERVSEGRIIAASGSTGFSAGPHLHFVIQINTGMNVASKPFEFESRGGGATPVKGMLLEAF